MYNYTLSTKKAIKKNCEVNDNCTFSLIKFECDLNSSKFTLMTSMLNWFLK